MNILLVEDENSICEVEAAYLRRAGYTVTEAADGQEALDKFSSNHFDLVVLDLNLPKVDGIEVCKRIRSKSGIPIIMVTARVEDFDELLGFETGADDYLKKPFNPMLLVARVKSLLKRLSGNKINKGDLSIDPEKMLVQKNDEKLELTTTQFNILFTLASHAGKVFTRDEILDKAYEETLPRDIFNRTVDAHIKSIRKVIEEDTKKPKYILTVIGKGYKFNDEI